MARKAIKYSRGDKVWVTIGNDTYKGKIVDIVGAWCLVKVHTGLLSTRRFPMEKQHLKPRK